MMYKSLSAKVVIQCVSQTIHPIIFPTNRSIHHLDISFPVLELGRCLRLRTS